MDFTLKTYKLLLQTLKDGGYPFITFSEYVESRKPEDGSRSPFIILRHDVDLLPQNSLAFARIQHEMGIRGSYYFRAVPESWDESIIKEIHNLGHEVGYHYEDVDLVKLEGRRSTQQYGKPTIQQSNHEAIKQVNDSTNQQINEPLIDAAILSFRHNLEKLRRLVPVKTICMHGSPRSKYDNRDLWKKYDYRDFGILGEPYFDVDFDDVFYLTDTGRRWDGWKVSIRDKVPQQERWVKEGLVFGSTFDILKRVVSEKIKDKSEKVKVGRYNPHQPFPDRVMFTFHPQRWTDKPIPWLKEYIMQNVKNVVKRLIVSTVR